MSKYTFQDLIAIEKQMNFILQDTINEICDEIKSLNIDGVKPLDNKGLCFTINFSKIVAWNISADFYSAQAQSNLIKRFISKSKNCYDLISKLAECIKNEKIKVNNCTYAIHPQVIKYLINKIKELKGSET